MSTLTVGRAVVGNVTKVRRDQNRLAISGRINTDDPNLLAAVRDQFAGLSDPDEPVVPVAIDADSSVNGYYRLVSAQVDDGHTKVGWWPYTVDLEPIVTRQAPVIESRIIGAVRPNYGGWVAGNLAPYHGLPVGTSIYDADLPFSTRVDRPIAGGSTVPVVLHSALLNAQARWLADPGQYYAGAAAIETSPNADGVWLPTIGTEVRKGVPWRITNGIIKVSAPTAPYVGGGFDFSAWHSALGAWSTPKTWQIMIGAGVASLTDIKSVTVVRNTAAVCTVRIGFSSYGGITGFALSMDLTVRRGGRLVEVTLVGPAQQWGLQRNPSDPSSSNNGPNGQLSGIIATSYDSENRRWVAWTPNVVLASNVGRIYSSLSLSRVFFGVGIAEVTDGLSGEYFAAQNETVRIVGR